METNESALVPPERTAAREKHQNYFQNRDREQQMYGRLKPPYVSPEFHKYRLKLNAMDTFPSKRHPKFSEVWNWNLLG
jgi:hypothetical protein